MKKLILIFLTTILVFSIIGIDVVLADNQGLTELETQQLKILKLSKLIEEQPSNIKLKEDLESYKAGLEFYQESNYQQAISELLKVEYSTLNLPLYIKSQYLLGDCYKKIEDLDKAIEIYQKLIPEDPLLTDYSLFFLAEAYKSKGEYKQSIIIFKRIIENFPYSLIISEVNYQIAQNYRELDDITSAVIYYKNILKDSKDSQLKAKILLELFEIYWQEKKYVDSLNCLYEILDKNYRLKRNSEPEELLIRRLYKIQKDVKDIKIPYPIMVKGADILFKYRQYNLAEDLYKKIIKTFPKASDIAVIYYKKARTLYYKKDYKGAINQCKEIIAKFPADNIIIKANYLEANSLSTLGERYLAIDKYEKIIEQYSQSYYARQAYLRLAESYFQLKETEKGISLWRELISKYPNSYESMTSLWNLARYYNNRDNYSAALKAYTELTERFSQGKLGDDALYWEGRTLQKMGQEGEADIVYKKLLNEYPLSYYAQRVIKKRKDLASILPISITKGRNTINLENFFKKYDKINKKGQLLLLKAELLEDISFYKESIIELKGALNYNSGNIFLLSKLSDLYKKNKDYYDSLNYTEIIFSYLEDNHQLEELPLELWESFYPLYYENTIRKYALKYKIDPLLVFAMIREESRFNPGNESTAGARGLMQIIFSTGEWIAQKINLENFNDEMLFSPEINIDLGCWYIHYLKEKFSNDSILIISGYNAGPGITDKWLKYYDISDEDNFIENIPYAETREHIKKVTKSYLIYKKLDEILNEK